VDHERDRYSAECAVDFSGVTDPGLLALRPKLGTSIATFTVNVLRIAIASETTRDAVFWETKTYDAAKLAALNAWADPLYARLSSQPVQAIAEKRSSATLPGGDPVAAALAAGFEKLLHENPRCASYHFAVVDPITGWRADLNTKPRYDGSDAEIEACFGVDAFPETARKAAKTLKLTEDDFWGSIPYSLSQHLRMYVSGNVKVTDDANGNVVGWSRPRAAHFQLFDDGWRIIDIADAKE
jgi:hypothetical protein